MNTSPMMINSIRRMAYILTMTGLALLLYRAIPLTMIAVKAVSVGADGAGRVVLQAAACDGGCLLLLWLLLIFRKRAMEQHKLGQ